MRRSIIIAAALGAAVGAAAAPVAAQPATTYPAPLLAGTRLDVSAVGEVTRVPDTATISAGVVTRSATATGALSENSARMERVRAALRRAGIAERDIQTSNINLNLEYRYIDNQPPQLTGYSASNQVNVRFRDIARSGAIIDALVREGANQINGPSLSIDQPEAALDEARTKAVAAGRARAELYARALGMQVTRLLSVSEGGGYVPGPVTMQVVEARAADASTKIDPGEQRLQVTVSMSFELR